MQYPAALLQHIRPLLSLAVAEGVDSVVDELGGSEQYLLARWCGRNSCDCEQGVRATDSAPRGQAGSNHSERRPAAGACTAGHSLATGLVVTWLQVSLQAPQACADEPTC